LPVIKEDWVELNKNTVYNVFIKQWTLNVEFFKESGQTNILLFLALCLNCNEKYCCLEGITIRSTKKSTKTISTLRRYKVVTLKGEGLESQRLQKSNPINDSSFALQANDRLAYSDGEFVRKYLQHIVHDICQKKKLF
jgi:hypothetical protein